MAARCFENMGGGELPIGIAAAHPQQRRPGGQGRLEIIAVPRR